MFYKSWNTEEPIALVEELEGRFATTEPEVEAFVEEPGRFERLRKRAAELVERYPPGSARPPLFGVPVGVKDVFHVDGLPTRAGSSLPPEELQGPQSLAVSDLLAAGALVVGKAACTEFAYFAPGPTRNPLRLEHTPGGSSSGSAAAVAAGLCPVALGTQTIGSISRPAVFCGVAGYKPTYDRVSRQGMIPLAPSFDHVGPLASDLTWLRRVAAVICRGWHSVSPGFQKPVLGIPDGPYLECASKEAIGHFDRVIGLLEIAGFRLIRVPLMADFVEIRARHNRWVAVEAFAAHDRWLPRFSDLYHSKTLELLEKGRQVTESQQAVDRQGRERLKEELAVARQLHEIDVWISPATPGEAPAGLDSTGDPVMNLPWSQTGLPTLAFPVGLGPSGLPLGIQLAAGRGEDEQLFAWSESLEEVLA